MTETEIALQQVQAGVDASHALLGLGVSIGEDATTPELMAEQESPAYEDPIDQHTQTESAELRPDTNPHVHDNNTTAVTDEDQPAVAAAAASRPKSGTMRRKVAKRTYGSPVFALKPPPAPVSATVTTNTITNSAAASIKNDYYKYDESLSVPSLQLFRESAFRPLTETAAIIESEMGVASMEDLDMAAPMLLYSLSTSSSRNFNRKRKQREVQQEQEQQAAAEDMLLFTPPTSATVPSAPEPAVPSRVPSAKSPVPSPEKKKPASSEKIKRTRSKPSISLKKQESMSSAAASNGRATFKTSTKTGAKTKTKITKKKSRAVPGGKKGAVPDRVKRTYLKKGSSPPSGKMARAMKPKEPLIALPEIRADVVLPWPMDGKIIPSLHSNDVLSGRGNGVAIYPGNRQFRDFIRSFKDEYVRAYRNEKGNVASDVIRTVLSLSPPGRFVEKAKSGNGYVLVDYSRALEKTSQALREGSAALRVMVFKEEMYKYSKGGTNTAKAKVTEKAKAMNMDQAKDKSNGEG